MMPAGDDDLASLQPPLAVAESNYNAAASSSSSNSVFRVLCKGMLSSNREAAAVAAAVRGPRGDVVLTLHKPAVGFVPGRAGGDAELLVEAMALVEGLNAALGLGITAVNVMINHKMLHNLMVGLCRRTATGEDEQIADVIDQALLLARKKFEQFEISLVRKRQVRYVVKLATDGLLQQAGEERETCGICLEVSSRIHAVEGCGHGFCLPCMRKHVRVKLLHGLLPGCPSHGCRSMLSVEGSKAFLPAPALETMAQRIREAQIPPGDKLYCPYPKCSALMSLSQLVQATNTTKAAARKQCVSCGGWLCVRCKVPWHQGMGCHEYKQLRLLLPGKEEDAMLEKLAKRRLWRQCGRCKHMIELAGGCYHVRCRCGYAFCYGCGLQLQASCSCQQGQQGWRRRLFSCVPCPWWW